MAAEWAPWAGTDPRYDPRGEGAAPAPPMGYYAPPGQPLHAHAPPPPPPGVPHSGYPAYPGYPPPYPPLYAPPAPYAMPAHVAAGEPEVASDHPGARPASFNRGSWSSPFPEVPKLFFPSLSALSIRVQSLT